MRPNSCVRAWLRNRWLRCCALSVGLGWPLPVMGQLTVDKSFFSAAPRKVDVPVRVPAADGADFDDVVELPTGVRDVGVTFVPGFQTVELVNVVWIRSDEEAAAVSPSLFHPAGVAAPLQTLVDQETGVPGGTMGPHWEHQDPEHAAGRSPLTQVHGASPNSIGLIYGMRAVISDDYEIGTVAGGVLGSGYWNTRAQSLIVGPQAGAIWLQNFGPLAARLQGTAMAGYNNCRVEQNSRIGDLSPGRHNHPLYLVGTSSAYVESQSQFASSAEVIAEATLRLTNASAFLFGWNGIVVDNIFFADGRTNYQLPRLGLRDPGDQSLFVHNFYCGLQVLR
jgi:hypothetical protein